MCFIVACDIGHVHASVASLLAATLYQRNHSRIHKLWNIGSHERYILHMQMLLEYIFIYEVGCH
jgi:hypothetical protein